MAEILRADEKSALQKAAKVIRQGGLVAIPTETVYGLAADAFNPRAVARVFEAKNRPGFDPLIVHVGRPQDLSLVSTSRDPRVELLASRFWPGPLTLVLPKKERVPDLVCAGLAEVAVRMPRHPAAVELIRLAATPLAAPSANLFGRVSPTTAAHVAEQLDGKVDLILDGGPCQVGVESTVLSLAMHPPAVLRPGGTPLEDLRALLGEVVLADSPSDRPPAPGMLARHYSPRTPLRLLEPGQAPLPRPGARSGLLAFAKAASPHGFVAMETLSERGDLTEAAANLFSAMRRLDAAKLDEIIAEPCPETGLGLAIMNRLRRAASL